MTEKESGELSGEHEEVEKEKTVDEEACNLQDLYKKIDEEDEEDDDKNILAFEIKPGCLETIQKKCIDLDFPLVRIWLQKWHHQP